MLCVVCVVCCLCCVLLCCCFVLLFCVVLLCCCCLLLFVVVLCCPKTQTLNLAWERGPALRGPTCSGFGVVVVVVVVVVAGLVFPGPPSAGPQTKHRGEACDCPNRTSRSGLTRVRKHLDSVCEWLYERARDVNRARCLKFQAVNDATALQGSCLRSGSVAILRGNTVYVPQGSS